MGQSYPFQYNQKSIMMKEFIISLNFSELLQQRFTFSKHHPPVLCAVPKVSSEQVPCSIAVESFRVLKMQKVSFLIVRSYAILATNIAYQCCRWKFRRK